MEPYDKHDTQHKLNTSDDWLRKRQGLALPVLPPTTLEARHFFFAEIVKYAVAAGNEGKKNIDYVKFAQDWNQSADGKLRFYITPEVLAAYMKTWEKNTNIRASQDLISDALESISQTSRIFSAEHLPFPGFLTALPQSSQLTQGVLENTMESATLPASISTDLALSHPEIVPQQIPTPLPPSHSNSLEAFLNPYTQDIPIEIDTAELTTSAEILPEALAPSITPTGSIPSSVVSTPGPEDMPRETKRRRVVPQDKRKRNTVRTCRRCRKAECPGNSDISKCPEVCIVPCIKCGQFTGCRGVDKGRYCTMIQ